MVMTTTTSVTQCGSAPKNILDLIFLLVMHRRSQGAVVFDPRNLPTLWLQWSQWTRRCRKI
uniref:Uncharacterized protein n=1 Tax=Anopheles atroparvus TaxID=41427 RepID=A0AAG5CWS5_ANOAO